MLHQLLLEIQGRKLEIGRFAFNIFAEIDLKFDFSELQCKCIDNVIKGYNFCHSDKFCLSLLIPRLEMHLQ